MVAGICRASTRAASAGPAASAAMDGRDRKSECRRGRLGASSATLAMRAAARRLPAAAVGRHGCRRDPARDPEEHEQQDAEQRPTVIVVVHLHQVSLHVGEVAVQDDAVHADPVHHDGHRGRDRDQQQARAQAIAVSSPSRVAMASATMKKWMPLQPPAISKVPDGYVDGVALDVGRKAGRADEEADAQRRKRLQLVVDERPDRNREIEIPDRECDGPRRREPQRARDRREQQQRHEELVPDLDACDPGQVPGGRHRQRRRHCGPPGTQSAPNQRRAVAPHEPDADRRDQEAVGVGEVGGVLPVAHERAQARPERRAAQHEDEDREQESATHGWPSVSHRRPAPACASRIFPSGRTAWGA